MNNEERAEKITILRKDIYYVPWSNFTIKEKIFSWIGTIAIWILTLYVIINVR